MTGVNKVILIGHLGGDPDIHRKDGRIIATFSLATSENWRDKATGEKRERTEWHRIVIYSEGLAKVAEQYLKKGSKVYLEGANRTRSYADKTNTQRTITEVVLSAFHSQLVLLDRAERAPPPGEELQGEGPRAAAAAPDFDDEIPF